MILYDFISVELPAAEVRRAVLERDGLLSESTTTAYAHGEHLLLRVGPTGSNACLAKTVAVQVGTTEIHGECLNLPLLWKAVGTPCLFPRVDASLEVAPIAPTLTQLTIFGRYDPPLGQLGQSLDRLLLHRVAEHTIRAFLGEMARRLTSAPALVNG